MKSSIRDTVEGTGRKAKGIVKETIGKLSDNPSMEVEGAIEKIAGKVQLKSGEAKKIFKK
ncbi:MAG: CsbD family protein [Chitinivibrionales bacterium]|nr:CsbD family protein [Chitinivibrionales bacterium]